MDSALSLRLMASAAILTALGCGEDPANANVCPNLPLYHVQTDQNGVDTLVKPNGQPLSAAEIRNLQASEDQGCTTPVGTALTDPNQPRPQAPSPSPSPAAGGAGGAGGAADGGT